MGQEAAPLGGEDRGAARAAALTVELDPEGGLERNQAVANALLGDSEGVGRPSNLARPRDLDERGNLIGGHVWKGHGRTIQPFSA
jgi:hypothetical protein